MDCSAKPWVVARSLVVMMVRPSDSWNSICGWRDWRGREYMGSVVVRKTKVPEWRIGSRDARRAGRLVSPGGFMMEFCRNRDAVLILCKMTSYIYLFPPD